MAQRITDIVMLGVFIAAVAAAAAFGAMFMPGAWYAELVKPAWTPPNAVFGPVWTVLYVMIAVAGWLAWQAGARAALAAWVVALALNAAWSWLFFGRQLIGVALADITLLWCAIALFIGLAWKPARWAAVLFIPYLLWVGYASALNLQIWRLNP